MFLSIAGLLHRRTSPDAAVQGSRERGSSTVETAILISLLITLFLTVMQGSLWWWSRNVTLGAAQQAARASAQEDGSAAAGRAAAASFIAQSKAGLSDVSIDVNRSATIVRVTISGKAMSVIPGFNQTITQTSVLPVERITRP